MSRFDYNRRQIVDFWIRDGIRLPHTDASHIWRALSATERGRFASTVPNHGSRPHPLARPSWECEKCGLFLVTLKDGNRRASYCRASVDAQPIIAYLAD